MDANAKLARLRYMAKVAESNPLTDHGVGEFLAAFRELDEHLSGGGRPPEAWREGPDAVGELNERIDQALLVGYRKATATNHATILRLEDEIYALRGGEPRRTCGRCGHEVARYPSGWAHTAPGNGDHAPELGDSPEPLGGPVPGVDGSHLPELDAWHGRMDDRKTSEL